MENFWDFSVWGWFNVLAVLLMSLLAAKTLEDNATADTTVEPRICVDYVEHVISSADLATAVPKPSCLLTKRNVLQNF